LARRQFKVLGVKNRRTLGNEAGAVSPDRKSKANSIEEETRAMKTQASKTLEATRNESRAKSRILISISAMTCTFARLHSLLTAARKEVGKSLQRPLEEAVKTRRQSWLIALAVLVPFAMAPCLSAQQTSFTSAKHQRYKVVVLPPDGGPDSFLAGYLFPYAPLTELGTVGVAGDTSTPGFYNSYTWTDGKQTFFQGLPLSGDLSGSSTYINRINQWGLAAGYGTRINSVTGATVDNAAIWTPDGHIFQLSTPEGGQSHAVWINDFGQVSGWIENSTFDPCAFGVDLQFQSQAVIWEFGAMQLLGTLGGTNSYGEFINNLGQVSGHSETSNVPNPNTGCPPFDPFIWENGKMTDINPGNFGGSEGGTNFLNNRGQAVGFGTLYGDIDFHPFLWENGKVTDLFTVGNLGGGFASADNVNEEGHVVGISSLPGDETYHAVLWHNGGFTDLETVDGDDCSEPIRINSFDQIVGVSFSCETFVEHAFLWENDEIVDLDTLIPADSGIQLEFAAWINEKGVIAAQGVLTASGETRAVLLIPQGECDNECEAAIAANQWNAAEAPQVVGGAKMTAAYKALLRTGRLRPIAPARVDVRKPN
jgi:probable HAF family extracellular repeat protein